MFDLGDVSASSQNNGTPLIQDCLDFEFNFEEWINGTAELLHPFADPVKTQTAETSVNDSSVNDYGHDHNGQSSKETGAMRRVNRFGREYVCGRPLSLDIRRAICDLFRAGSKPCEIASVLNVTHGCVSKIVKRYQTTGSVEARKIGGSHPRKSLPAVVNAIVKYKTDQPTLRTWELRDRLIADGLCDWDTLPTTSSINRIIRQNLGRFFSRKNKQNGPPADADYNNNDTLRPFDMVELPVDLYRRQLSSVSSISDSSVSGCYTPPPSTFNEFCFSPTESTNYIANSLPESQDNVPLYSHAIEA